MMYIGGHLVLDISRRGDRSPPYVPYGSHTVRNIRPVRYHIRTRTAPSVATENMLAPKTARFKDYPFPVLTGVKVET